MLRWKVSVQVYRPSVKELFFTLGVVNSFNNQRGRSVSRYVTVMKNLTSSSAITEGLHDALSQLKSCQLLHHCMKNHI